MTLLSETLTALNAVLGILQDIRDDNPMLVLDAGQITGVNSAQEQYDEAVLNAPLMDDAERTLLDRFEGEALQALLPVLFHAIGPTTDLGLAVTKAQELAALRLAARP